MRLVFVETYQWFSIITPAQVAVWVSSCRWGVAQKCTAQMCGVSQTSKKSDPRLTREGGCSNISISGESWMGGKRRGVGQGLEVPQKAPATSTLAWAGSSVRGWENQRHFQHWHVCPAAAGPARGWAGGCRCVLSASSRGKDGCELLFGSVWCRGASQRDIRHASLHRAGEHWEVCRGGTWRRLMNSYFHHWVFAPGRKGKAKKSVYRMRYG